MSGNFHGEVGGGGFKKWQLIRTRMLVNGPMFLQIGKSSYNLLTVIVRMSFCIYGRASMHILGMKVLHDGWDLQLELG